MLIICYLHCCQWAQLRCVAVHSRGDGRQCSATCCELDLCPSVYDDAVRLNAAIQIGVLSYNVATVGLRQRTAMYALWTGLVVGTHPGIAHILAAVAAFLSTSRWTRYVSLSRVAIYCYRAVGSGVGGESSSQHGCHECQIVVHQARTVARRLHRRGRLRSAVHGQLMCMTYADRWITTSCSTRETS